MEVTIPNSFDPDESDITVVGLDHAVSLKTTDGEPVFLDWTGVERLKNYLQDWLVIQSFKGL